MNAWVGFVLGLIVGAIVAWLWARSHAKSAEGALGELRRQLEELPSLRDRLRQEVEARIAAETRLEEAKAGLVEQRKLVNDARDQLADTFRALSAEVLEGSNRAFLDLAQTAFRRLEAEAQGDLKARQKEMEGLISPLRETLDRYERQVQEIEKSRQSAYGALDEQLRSLAGANLRLQEQALTLSTALKGGPGVRGRWGEMTLRRAAELAGMSEHCDFVEQETLEGETGRTRPDMIVNLPGGRRIAVDAKAPLRDFLEAAAAANEEERHKALNEHAKNVRRHMNQLAARNYWEQFDPAPEIVVLFLPGESFFGAALEADPALIEDGMEKRVVLATPTTLIALLRAVAYGWRQQQIAQNALEISELGKQLYERLRTFVGYFDALGNALGKAVESFNKATGSLESRVLISARKFKELGAAGGEELAEVSPIEETPRELAAPEKGGLP